MNTDIEYEGEHGTREREGIGSWTEVMNTDIEYEGEHETGERKGVGSWTSIMATQISNMRKSMGQERGRG